MSDLGPTVVRVDTDYPDGAGQGVGEDPDYLERPLSNPEGDEEKKPKEYSWSDNFLAQKLTSNARTPIPKNDPTILSCGLGIDSVSMLLLLTMPEEAGKWLKAHNKPNLIDQYPIDAVYFADPGHEHKATYDLLHNYLVPYCDELGIPVYLLKRWSPGHGFRSLGQEMEDNGTIPFLPGVKRHVCSVKYKVEPQKWACDEMFGGVNPVKVPSTREVLLAELEKKGKLPIGQLTRSMSRTAVFGQLQAEGLIHPVEEYTVAGGGKRSRWGLTRELIAEDFESPDVVGPMGVGRFHADKPHENFRATFLIGLNAGEEDRRKHATTYATNETTDPGHGSAYPMMDMRINRMEEEAIIAELQPGWPTVIKSSCIFCPFMSVDELRLTFDDYPAEWEYVNRAEDRFHLASQIKHHGGEWMNRYGQAVIIDPLTWKKNSWANGVRLFWPTQKSVPDLEKMFRTQTTLFAFTNPSPRYSWADHGARAITAFRKHQSWSETERDLQAQGLTAEEVRGAIHAASSEPLATILRDGVVLRGSEIPQAYQEFLNRMEANGTAPELATPEIFTRATGPIPSNSLEQLNECYESIFGPLPPRPNPVDSKSEGWHKVLDEVLDVAVGAMIFRAVSAFLPDWDTRDDPGAAEVGED